MAETRIELHRRKVRNGIRRGAIKGERTMRFKTWQALTAVAPPKPKLEDIIVFANPRSHPGRIYYMSTPEGNRSFYESSL